MFTFADEQKRAVEKIVLNQLETGEQIKRYFSHGKAPSGSPGSYADLYTRYKRYFDRAYEKNCMFFTESGLLREGEYISVFMDYLKYKPELAILSPYDKGSYAPMHIHNYFELVYVYKGKCISCVNGVEQTFHSGDLCLYSLQAKHYCYLPTNEDIIFNFIIHQSVIDEVMLEMLQGADLFTNFFIGSLTGKHQDTCLVFHTRELPEALFYINKMILIYYNNNQFNNQLMRSLFICLLSELAQHYGQISEICTSSQQNTPALSEITSYLEKHCQTINLEQVSKHFYFSSRTFHNLLLRYTGRTFTEILREIRLKKAEQLVLDENIPLDSIHSLVGYSSRHYLDKLFRSKKGMSIGKYRKLLLQQQV